MLSPFQQMLVTIICAVLASSGFWAFLQNRRDRKDISRQIILGLAHDRILELGNDYVDRGWISDDEFENLNDYLYKPYEKMGGNGSAKRIMDKVKLLPNKPPHE